MNLSAEDVRDLFDYDPAEPFALRWRNPPKFSNVQVGTIAGHWHETRGGRFRYVAMSDKRFLVHRLVWLHVKGTEPPRYLGFADGSPSDCRIENLVTTKREKRLLSSEYWKIFRKTRDPIEWSARLRRRNLKRDYGITPEQYAAMLAEQDGLCAICDKPESLVRRGKIELLSVDHCHDSDRVRALLCSNCNNGLGRFLDDPALLRAAADYLERHAGSPSMTKRAPILRARRDQ